MNNQSLISIILPSYNREEYLGKAIDSVLSQTYRNFELIVINDDSTSETAKLLSQYIYKDSRIKVIRNEKNIGFVKSLNKGISLSRGKYIARLDDDDFWCYSQKLEKQVAFLEDNPDYVLVGGAIIRIDGQGKEIMRFILPKSDKDIRQVVLQSNPFAHSAVVFRKEAWDRTGGYDETLAFSEDWDLWMRFGKIGKFYNFQEYFTCYLQGKQNKSNFNIKKNLKLSTKIIKKHRNDYPNFWKAFLLCWAYYFYSFLPIRGKFRPFCLKLRKVIFRIKYPFSWFKPRKPTIRWNRVWNNPEWDKDGDEWNDQAAFCNKPYGEWKNSVTESFIYRNINENSTVLEIAPGHGRWTEFILRKCRNLILVDLNQKCIEFCKKRFLKFKNIEYHTNNGKDLSFIKSNSIDFIWSYDSFVHMEKEIFESYFKEFSRVLKKSGKVIIHHPGGWKLPRANKGNRSDVTKDLVKKIAEKSNLLIKYQIQSWGDKNKYNCKLYNDYITELIKK